MTWRLGQISLWPYLRISRSRDGSARTSSLDFATRNTWKLAHRLQSKRQNRPDTGKGNSRAGVPLHFISKDGQMIQS